MQKVICSLRLPQINERKYYRQEKKVIRNHLFRENLIYTQNCACQVLGQTFMYDFQLFL